ncbi:MAG TPA: family 43 glycosylhydrolase [Verrucomicrobiae bacterium]
MQKPNFLSTCILILLAFGGAPAHTLDGAIGIHDPSTVVKCDGKYYVAGTGRGVSFLVSSNGFDWQHGGGTAFERVPDSVLRYCPQNNGATVWAPDIIKVNDHYYVYYSISRWGQYVSAIGLVTSPTLDASSSDYRWTDRGMVVHSSEGEDLNAIDPGACLAPDGTLWISYGSYHGNIELVQLDPKTGLCVAANSPVSIIANGSEASDIIHHDSYFYLFVNHGSCCSGSNSTYNIRVGRAEKITGPYLDRYGENMAGGGGTLFVAAAGNDIGPGHFGLLQDDGVEKFSCHYEAVIGRTGRPVLDIRPLLWTLDGWPMPGDNLRQGTYQIRSLRTSAVLQSPNKTNSNQTAVQTARYLIRENQTWDIAPAGHGFYKIINVQNTNALTQTETATELAPFASQDNQLWKIDQLTDASYRLKSKSNALVLTALPGEKPGNAVGLRKFDGDASQHWVIVAP